MASLNSITQSKEAIQIAGLTDEIGKEKAIIHHLKDKEEVINIEMKAQIEQKAEVDLLLAQSKDYPEGSREAKELDDAAALDELVKSDIKHLQQERDIIKHKEEEEGKKLDALRKQKHELEKMSDTTLESFVGTQVEQELEMA